MVEEDWKGLGPRSMLALSLASCSSSCKEMSKSYRGLRDVHLLTSPVSFVALLFGLPGTVLWWVGEWSEQEDEREYTFAVDPDMVVVVVQGGW